MEVCVFAGTFDPLTKGHYGIIKKCLKNFDKVILVVGENPDKTPLFSPEERTFLAAKTFENNPKIKVINYSLIEKEFSDFLLREGVKTYVRGIRNEKDLEFEKKAEEKNRLLYPEITTVYYYSNKRYSSVSSSMVKELILGGKKYKKYLPRKTFKALKTLKENKGKN